MGRASSFCNSFLGLWCHYGSVHLGSISWGGQGSRALYTSLECLSALGMFIFLNRFYWFGVVGLCTLGVH